MHFESINEHDENFSSIKKSGKISTTEEFSTSNNKNKNSTLN